MKHTKLMSKRMPVKAILPEGHPDLGDSLKGFLQNPFGTLWLHIAKD